MPDYKTLYYTMFRATEQAIRLLIAAQQECEELYLRAAEADRNILPLPMADNKNVDKQ